ncbi:hypothetical protein [Arthrobacter sp. GMC3]|uniref:hypothetical protein n=1 Tax=Arthrobacter sp. GMC3 TaxID=2058894 RepID=UPI000CE52B78|nr:hypothetical protein [Arthrobacter sp. GMC3]
MSRREDKYALNESMVSEATPWDTVADLALKERRHDLPTPISGDMTTRWSRAREDALDEWSAACPPGGFVCSECGMPTESEPCEEHQKNAWKAMTDQAGFSDL